MANYINKKFISAMAISVMAVFLAIGMNLGIQPLRNVYAAVNTYGVTGGNPGALPTVGAASVLLPTITITEDGAADDFLADPETITVVLNSAAYPAVVFDSTVVTGDLVIAGSCGYTAANALVYTDAYTVQIPVINGTACAPGEVITIANLKVKTIYAQAAPGAAPLITVDNTTTGAGSPIATSDTVNLSVAAADAAATVTLGANSVVGAAGNTTLALTVPFALDANDTVDITFPPSFNVSGVGAAVTGTFESTDSITCAAALQVVTCTTSAATNATGTIIMTGITTLYVDATDVTSVEVEDEGVAANDIATDTSVATTDITAADAAASIALAGNSVVGVAGNTTLTFTIPLNLANGDTVTFTMPNNIEVVGTAFVSTTFGGTGFSGCAEVGQAITCTVNTDLTAGTGNIVMSGMSAVYAAAAANEVTNLAVNDISNGGADIATDTTVEVTDTTAADAAGTLAFADATVGAVQNSTLTLTLPRDLAVTDTVTFTLIASVSASGVAYVSDTFAGAGNFTCSNAGINITCTVAVGAITAGTGNIVFSGVSGLYESPTQNINSLAVNDVVNGAGADIATDATVTQPAIAVAGANASLTLANGAVGAVQNTTLALTLPRDIAATDTITFTLPTNVTASGVAFVSETFGGAGTFTCANVGNAITCTATGAITAGAGNIVFSGVTGAYAAGAGNVADLAVNDFAIDAGADIATDTTVALTATTAVDAAASLTLANGVVGAVQNTTLALTLPRDLAVTDTITFTLPANVSASGVAYVSDTFAGAGNFTCANVGNAITCTVAVGAITAGAGNIVFSGVTGAYAAGAGNVANLAVNDVVNGAGADIATDTTVALTATTAANAVASLALSGNSVVGAAGNSTFTLTLPVDIGATDTVGFTVNTNLVASGVAYVSDTFGGAGAFACANVGNVITCTANGAITAGTGDIVVSGITSIYASAIQDIFAVSVIDTGNGDVALDGSGAVTATTAADANASLALAGNSVVGAAGNTTLTLTLPVDMGNTDTVAFTAPAKLNVSAVAFSSETFAGAGTFSACAAVGQVITCTANGAITAGTGTIVMSGITSIYASVLQSISSVVVDDTGNGNTATDASGTVTDTTAADAAASLALSTNSVVGAAGNSTLTLTIPVDLGATDTVSFSIGNLNVSGVAYASDTFAGAGSFACAPSGQSVICTADGTITAGTGTIVMSGITSIFAVTGNSISSVVAADTGNGNVAADASGAVTDVTAADAAASLTLASGVVGAVQNTTLALTIPRDLANTDTIIFTLLGNVSASGVATVSETFGGAGTFTCANAGNAITCTATGVITAGTGNIVFSGVTGAYAAGIGTASNLAVNATANAGADIAVDTTVAMTATTAADAAASVALGTNSVVGAAGNTTVTLTVPFALDAADTIDITFPAFINVSGVGAAVTGTFEASDSITCAAALQVVTCTTSAATNATGTIIMTGIVSSSVGTTDISVFEVEDEGVAANDIATDATVALTDTTAASLTATNVEPATLTASASGMATVTFTTVNPIPNDGKIKVAFGAGFNVAGAAGGACSTMDGTFVTSVAGQVVTITRQADGAPEAAGAQTCTINAIVNPASSGSTGVYDITTSNAADVVIDQDAAVAADTIASTLVACNDGVDNDSDGLIDMNDTGCSVGTDTSEVNEVSAGGGGGGGGGANVVSNSNTSTSLVPSTIGTVSGNQTYSRPVLMNPASITVNTEDQTKTAEVTSNGTLTLRPNAKSTISLTIPQSTSVTGTADWSGQIDPPVITTMPAMGIKGAEISGTKDRLFKSNVEVFVKVGAKSSNLTFSNDITLEIPVDLPNGTEVNLYSSGDGLVWIPQGTATVQNGKLQIKTNHLTYFAVENTGGVVVKPKIQIVFEDITGHWGEVFILNIANLGIVSGKTATEFAPNDAITRAEITKIAAKAFGLSVAPVVNSNPFDDVPSAAWFAPFIAAAQSEGIISGYGDGSFRPNNRVTRAEALKILIAAAAFGDVDEHFDTNYVGRVGWTFAAFPDVALDAWFAKFAAYAKDKGIAGGYADGNFKPTNEITRAEVAKLVTKILEMK